MTESLNEFKIRKLREEYKKLTGKDHVYTGKGGIDPNSKKGESREIRAIRTCIKFHKSKRNENGKFVPIMPKDKPAYGQQSIINYVVKKS